MLGEINFYFMNNTNFENCKHDWVFHLDVDKTGGPATGNSIFRCKNCGTIITLIEKCVLDQAEAQKKSLAIQERHTKIGMWANIISAATLIIAFLTLLFGDKLLSCFAP